MLPNRFHLDFNHQNNLQLTHYDNFAEQMNTMAGEYLTMKDSVSHQNLLMKKLEDENAKHKSLIEENSQQRANRDKQLEEISKEVNLNIQ